MIHPRIWAIVQRQDASLGFGHSLNFYPSCHPKTVEFNI